MKFTMLFEVSGQVDVVAKDMDAAFDKLHIRFKKCGANCLKTRVTHIDGKSVTQQEGGAE